MFKRFFKKMGFRKQDELDRQIYLKAARSYFFINALLSFALFVYEKIKYGEIQSIYYLVYLISFITWLGTILFYNYRMSKDD